MPNQNDFVDKKLLEEIQSSKYFPQIHSYLGDSIEDYYKGIQRIKNKSRSKNFRIFKYLQCFAIFTKYLQDTGISYEDLKKLSYNDRNLIYGNFIDALEKGEITQEIGKRKGKPYSLSSIRNVFQSRVQACLRFLDLRVEQPRKSVITGTTKNYKNKVVLTQEINRLIYDRIESKPMKLLFIFQLNTGLRFSDLQEDYRIYEDANGYWYLKDVNTAKEEVTIPFIPLSKEFKEMTLKYSGKEPRTTKDLFKSRNGTPISIQSYNQRLDAILHELIKLGLLEENTTISSHSIRKFYYNQWLRTGDIQLAEYMMGHSTGITLGIVYSQYQILEKYQEIEPYFLVSTTIIDRTDERIDELTREITQKDEQIQKLTQALKKRAEQLAQLNLKLNEIIMTEQKQEDINALLLEAIKLTVTRDYPRKTVEVEGPSSDVPMSQTHTQIHTSEKLQKILEKLSKFIN
ncbi:MAG: tyrosine-type recombinase/integrase [Candidatus Helarchaeota archaeon]